MLTGPNSFLAADASEGTSLEDLEIEGLLEAVYRHYGYDFRNYAFTSLRRRVRDRVRGEGVRTVTGLKEKVLHDTAAMERLLLGLSVNVSAMFRDPSFYLAFRQRVVPLLRTYPFIRIWHAGCSSGEEVYSMAILLKEEGLLDRCRLYATDINDSVLRTAQAGIFPLSRMKQHTANYLAAGGKEAFSGYYTASYDNAIFRPALRENMVFAQHNLATDGPFNEFHVIMCRNVMIYFNKTLQERVNTLFAQSLVRLGFLCLGAKESLKYSSREGEYEEFDHREKIYRRWVKG
jgi:chemotaxis protein methyltransferase CheR